MLKVENISAGYGKLQILNGISIEARPQQITVIVGPNGSGKSTLLKTIAGLTNIYAGSITSEGRKTSGLQPHEIARSGIAYLPQTESVFAQLSVIENFKMAGYTVKPGEFEGRFKYVMGMFPNLEAYLKTKASNLSGGERQMVAMSMALIRNPRVIMFDEPTANLSPKIAMQVLQTISQLSRETDMTILLVEQNAFRALEIGDSAYLLVSGKTVFSGTGKALLEQKELGKLYLGLKTSEDEN
ncbi:MAG: ABC transporter ATP-binding protein [Nitrososphaerales archaeon]